MTLLPELLSILEELKSLQGVENSPRVQRGILESCFMRLLLLQDSYGEIFQKLAIQIGADMSAQGNTDEAGEVAATRQRRLALSRPSAA